MLLAAGFNLDIILLSHRLPRKTRLSTAASKTNKLENAVSAHRPLPKVGEEKMLQQNG